jgi:hypothetical protein
LIAGRDTKFVSDERYANTTRQKLHDALCLLLIGGNLAFGLFAMLMPKKVGVLLDEDEAAVRKIAAKDLAAGIALATARNKPMVPLLMQTLANVREGLGWLRRKPVLAGIPLLWAGVSLAALLTRDQEDEFSS